MNTAQKQEKLQEIFRDILENDALELTPELSTKTCPDWDSVAMVQIVLSVESSFGVRFSTDEVAGIKSVAELLKKIDAA